MGKYIRKSKIGGRGESSIAVMDVVSPSSSSLGVLTRAKSLALQQQQQQRRLQKSSSSSSSSSSPLPPNPPPKRKKQKQQQINDCGSYLQLRSRRLQKKPPIVVSSSTKQQRRKETCGKKPNPDNNPQILDSIRGSICVDGSRSDSVSESVVFRDNKELICEINKKPSFGEKILEFEEASQSFNRTTRESTPCSLIRKPEIIKTPESSTKLNICINERNQREETLMGSHRHLPSTPEMDEFFAVGELEQQKQFIEKYNFDPVNEQPLPGRFEWTKVDD